MIDGSNSNGLVLEAVYEEEVANTKYTADVRPLLELGKAVAGKKPKTFIKYGAAGLRKAAPTGPVVIGPGHDFVLHLWNVGNVTTPPSYEVEVGWWER